LLYTEKIKSFLAEFYLDDEGGGKEFVYGKQLVRWLSILSAYLSKQMF